VVSVKIIVVIQRHLLWD